MKDISFIPVNPNGTEAGAKAPLQGVQWKQYQQRKPTPEEQAEWAKKTANYGVVCGKVSGNLEVIDFDDDKAFKIFCLAYQGAVGVNKILENLFTTVKTPHGYHMYYRSSAIEGNLKLATSAEGKTLIETRGEGGYVVGPESVVNDVKYQYVSGTPRQIMAITPDDRDFIHSLCRQQTAHVVRPDPPEEQAGRPGDVYNAKMAWDDVIPLLEQEGWSLFHDAGDYTQWSRPGKATGVSASINANGHDMFFVFTSNAPPFEPNKGYTKFSVFALLKHKGDFGAAAAEAAHTLGMEQQNGKDKDNQTKKLRDLAFDHLALFQGTDGCVYASLVYGVVPLNSPMARYVLAQHYEAKEGSIPSPSTLSAVIDILTDSIISLTQIGKLEQQKICVRVGEHEGNLYVDLNQGNREAVMISKAGWKVVDSPPVKFKRPEASQPLPYPKPGGRLNDLRKWVNVGGDSQWILFVSWMIGAYTPFIDYPILLLQGDPGGAKTTAAKILRWICDPNRFDLLKPPKPDEFISDVHDNHVLVYDNFRSLTLEMSDLFTMTATGSGFAKRQLYTDFGRVGFNFKRPIALNGIDDLTKSPDFASRALSLTFPEIPKGMRLTRAQVESAVTRMVPQLLGCIFDVLAEALRNYRSVAEIPDHRLSDFTHWILCAMPALPWSKDEFMLALKHNDQTLSRTMVSNDPVSQALVELMTDRVVFEGTAMELHDALAMAVPPAVRKGKDWPSNVSWFGRRLGQIKKQMEHLGIVIETTKTARCINYKIKREGA